MPLTNFEPVTAAHERGRWQTLLLCVAFALALAYLSFLPFIYEPLPLEEALRRFSQLPYLAIGARGRADWVANLVMYVPLGFLLARLLLPVPRGQIEPLVLIGALLIGGAWAVAIEFAQLSFPNRTVSLNDVVAEVIGAAAGALLWLLVGKRWKAWWKSIVHGGVRTARAVLNAYVIAYLLLSLSPFDFVLGGAEFAEHLRSPLVGAWMADVSCEPLRCSWRLLFETALTAPLGLWWALRRRSQPTIFNAISFGLALGVLLEGLQLFLVSGVSQGASVIARAAGFALGTMAYAHRDGLAEVERQRYGRPLVLVLVLPYLWAVASLNGLAEGQSVALAVARERFGEVSWLPFYFHYYTAEPAAIRSGILHTLLYVPVGVAAWLWARQAGDMAPARTALIAAAIASLAEFGKLFFPPRHPDITDVLIAAGAAGLTAAILRSISRSEEMQDMAIGSETAKARAGADKDSEAARPGHAGIASPGGSTPPVHVDAQDGRNGVGPASLWTRLIGGLALVTVAATSFNFPVAPVVLSTAFIGYALLLARMPLVYLWVVPVALTVFDLAPWSGRFFWDEFDMLLMVTLGVRLLLGPPPWGRQIQWPWFAVGLLLAATATSVLMALLPFPAIDANAFTNYLSQFNALRVGKGVVWGVLVAWLVAHDSAASPVAARRLVEGLSLALLVLGAAVLWERVLFSWVLALDGSYRVTGPVSAMHIGGAYLDALLVGLAPFALLLVMRGSTLAWRATGVAALVLGFYAVVVTYSRAPLAAWVIGVSVFALLWARRAWQMGSPMGRGHRRVGFVLGVGILALAIAGGALFASRTLQERFSNAFSDFTVRDQHWRSVVGMMQFDATHILFGMGLGSFPRYSYLRQGGAGSMGAYRFSHDPEQDKTDLTLHGGLLYVAQRVAVRPGETVQVAIDARAEPGEAELSISLCERAWLMNSASCSSGRIKLDGRFSESRLTLRVPESKDWRHAARPVALSLYTGGQVRVQIRRLSARDALGNELLKNGDFASGMDHWFFSADGHLDWHPKNALVSIFFEQGLVGLLAWVGIALAAVRRLALADRRLARVPALAAGLAALLFMALFDTVIDAPRLVILVLLLALFPLGSVKQRRSA